MESSRFTKYWNRSWNGPQKETIRWKTIHQVCASLKFFGSGCFLNEAGEGLGLEKSSVSRIIRDVTDCFANRAGDYISMPTTEQAVTEIKQSFYQTAPLPNIIGAIDGTHIPIKGPSTPFNEAAFVNRKGGHSINCMVVCDHKMRMLAVKADSPGSEHDSCTFNYSQLCGRLENGDLRGSGILLGDSGYPLRPYLFTPLLNPITPQEKLYNRFHKRVRCIIERAIGLLKSRFRCIDRSAGCLNFAPTRASKIALTCVVLHNICINLREPEIKVVVDEGDDDNVHNNVGNRHDGVEARRQVIDNLQ